MAQYRHHHLHSTRVGRVDCRVGKGNTHTALHPLSCRPAPSAPILGTPGTLPLPASQPALHLPHTTQYHPQAQHGSSSSSRRLTLAGSAQVQAEVAARHQALAVAVAVAVVVALPLCTRTPKQVHTPTPNCSHDRDETRRCDAGTDRQTDEQKKKEEKGLEMDSNVRAKGHFYYLHGNLDTVSCIYNQVYLGTL